MAEFAFSWERQAMRGEPMPDGLSLVDQMAYTAMRNIYKAYRSKYLSREQAAAEKQKVRLTYVRAVEREKFQNKITEYHVRLIKASEGAKCACRKNPSPENAIWLCDVMDGIKRPVAAE